MISDIKHMLTGLDFPCRHVFYQVFLLFALLCRFQEVSQHRGKLGAGRAAAWVNDIPRPAVYDTCAEKSLYRFFGVVGYVRIVVEAGVIPVDGERHICKFCVIVEDDRQILPRYIRAGGESAAAHA
jgi:hypothetical protein